MTFPFASLNHASVVRNNEPTINARPLRIGIACKSSSESPSMIGISLFNTSSFVKVLLTFCSPSAVFKEVPFFVVNTIYRKIARPFSHIVKKVKEVISPPTTNENTSSPVVSISSIIGVMTPGNYICPYFIRRRMTEAMTILTTRTFMTSSGYLSAKARSGYFSDNATRTLTDPSNFFIISDGSFFQNFPFTKNLVCKINEFAHLNNISLRRLMENTLITQTE